jgi:hypothetical protein
MEEENNFYILIAEYRKSPFKFLPKFFSLLLADVQFFH